MKLFISYSRDDKNYVYELARLLKDDADYDVWIDRRLIGADKWWQTILDGIEQSECFVMVMTPRSLSSIFCMAELNYALALKKPILPLMLKPCDLPPALKSVQFINVETITLERALFLCQRSLSKVERELMEGQYTPPQHTPRRPNVPEPANEGDHLFELYAAAEEAYADDELALARELFGKVVTADPQGVGIAAQERLDEMNSEVDRAVAYGAVKRMAENAATRRGAVALWKAFQTKYGDDYDPDGVDAIITAN